MNINLDNRTFVPTHNSTGGEVNGDTVFHYHQAGNMVTADYRGGTIRCGTIIAILKDQLLDMRYQCLTTNDELKSGKATGAIGQEENGKLHLSLQWQWLDADGVQGTSEYSEQ